MKKVILSIAVLLCVGSAISQVRFYDKCTYSKVRNNETPTYTEETIKVKWEKNDASNIENISYISYPEGFIIPITEMEYDGEDSKGNTMFKFTAVDEGKRDVVCYLTKFSKRDIAISIAYSKNLIYSFLINLFEYTEQFENNNYNNLN
jgi:hypothetical protein